MEDLWEEGRGPKPPLLIQPNIGLESDVRRSVVNLLNVTLADEIVLTTKTRCAHWNAGGADFLRIHTLLEGQYHLLNNICDEIAERARMLGGFAIGSLEEFVRHSRLAGQPGDVPDVLRLLADHETTIRFLREDVRKCAEEYEDAGTYELLVGVMRSHEKITWMLRSCMEAQGLNEQGHSRNHARILPIKETTE